MSPHFAWLLLLQAQGFTAVLFQMFPLVVIFALFYFLIILPQRKRQQQTDQMLNNLKPGDRIVTNGGLIGIVTIVREDRRIVQLKIAENPSVRVDVLRSAITGMADAPEEKK